MKNSKMVARKTIVKNELGMHARPASKIAQIAEKAQSDVWISTSSAKVDATSVIDILTLCAVKGTQVEIKIENQDDEMVLDQIIDFFELGFGEI